MKNIILSNYNSKIYQYFFKNKDSIQLPNNFNIHPIINYSANTITERTNKIKVILDNVLADNDNINIISLSVNGIDLKYFLAENEDYMNHINKIFFVGTPHNGSKVSSFADRNKIDSYKLEKCLLSLGIPRKSFLFYNKNNINILNNTLKTFINKYNSKLYNINCERLFSELSENLRILMNECNSINNDLEFYEKNSDGIFYENETISDDINQLLTMNLDHNEILLHKEYSDKMAYPHIQFINEFIQKY